METEYLKRRGYCIVSRSGLLAARIDKNDWESHGFDADYYRRCISKDVVVISKKQLKELKNSCQGYIKFRK